mmetsp:Transcript_30626/g.77419  ORF Transcript_30626/g.77419 Transcript_30626/m.77419 type:complete len:251 (-) Transcript_30626:563-1315(-)
MQRVVHRLTQRALLPQPRIDLLALPFDSFRLTGTSLLQRQEVFPQLGQLPVSTPHLLHEQPRVRRLHRLELSALMIHRVTNLGLDLVEARLKGNLSHLQLAVHPCDLLPERDAVAVAHFLVLRQSLVRPIELLLHDCTCLALLVEPVVQVVQLDAHSRKLLRDFAGVLRDGALELAEAVRQGGLVGVPALAVLAQLTRKGLVVRLAGLVVLGDLPSQAVQLGLRAGPRLLVPVRGRRQGVAVLVVPLPRR